jgi:hypothetical protein
METSFYLSRPKADSATAIFVVTFYHGLTLKYFIPEKIKPECWDKQTQRAKPKSFKEYREFNVA